MKSLFEFEKQGRKQRPIIALTGRIEQVPRPHAALFSSYVDAVFGGGGLPVILPVQRTDNHAHLLAGLDGLVLTGGEDVNPLFYGQTPHPKLVQMDAVRDQWELSLTRAWLDSGKPLLGICRGIQIMQVALGGALIQDLDSERPDGLGHSQGKARTDPIHEVEVDAGTLLSRLLECARTLPVNSIHHQAIAEAPKGFRVCARAPDQLIEAIEAEDGRPMLGVQWHPELMTAPAQKNLFANFINLSAATQRS